jgi:predicted dehydrogenase
MLKEVRFMGQVAGVGLIGTGWIGRVHAEQYLRVAHLCPLPGWTTKLVAVSDVVPELLQQTAKDFGFARQYANWHDVIADPEVTLVDICVPNVMHREIAVAAAAAGKHIFCEKPLSMSAADGRAMLDAVESAGVRHMVNFNYRRAPAVAFARQLLEQGTLGEVYHIRAGFSQDFYVDPRAPWTWRFAKASAGGGSISTMGCHVIDTVRYLGGEVTRLVADLQTVVRERPTKDGSMKAVDVDDASSLLLRFASGATGILYTTWIARGRKHHFEWEVNASRGSLCFNSERLNELQICEGSDPKDRQGFKTVYVGERHPFGEVFGLKSGMGIGIRETFLLQLREMLRAVAENTPASPDFRDGWQADLIAEAAMESAAKGAWIQV